MLWHFSLATSARVSFRALELVGGCCQLFLIAICFRQFDCKDGQGRCQRFCQTCIVQNPQLASTSANLKSSFVAMFKRTCPLFIETRWNFVHDTLKWLLHRREAFSYLAAGLEDIKSCKELSSHEIDMIVKLTDNGSWSQQFWLTAELCKTLADWGASVSVRLHACPCHPLEPEATDDETAKQRKLCKLKGRQSCALAWGLWRDFLNDLESLQPNAEALRLSRVLSVQEQEVEGASAADQLQDFWACKADMVFRARQAWSFWDKLPWAVLKIPAFLWGLKTETECREAALLLVQEYSNAESTSSLGVVAMRFLSPVGEFRDDLDAWIAGSALAPHTLRQALLYSSCLIVMQRLEAKHHYLHMQVSRGRASSPPATIAELRRKANPDISLEAFRAALPRLMGSFDALVAVPWQSFGDLLRAVYGHGLQQMHPEIDGESAAMQQHLQALADNKRSGDSNMLAMHRDHIQACFCKDQVYALPSVDVSSGTQVCEFHVFRVVSMNPANRMYIQRASAMSSDVAQLLLSFALNIQA